jgi:hypothetical protein
MLIPGYAERLVVLVDYWFVGRLGRVWLWARPGLRDRLGDVPAICQAIADGEPVPAAQTWRAQEFAGRVWFRFGLSACFVGVLLGVGVALLPSQAVRNWAIVIPVVFFGLMAVALFQMAWLRYRADQTRNYLRQLGTRGGNEPLPRDSMGRPNRFDFWVVTAIAVAVCAILAYAGLR